jgi:hypothetical protein
MSKVNPTLFLLVAAGCCLLPIAFACAEDVPSPSGAYAIRIERVESPCDAFRYSVARLVNARGGNTIQTLRPDDDAGYSAISVVWSPDSTLVAVYYSYKRDGSADVYRIRNGGATLLKTPEYSLPNKTDVNQPFLSRFDYRKPKKWSDSGTLILECSGRVQLKNATGGLLSEWMDYEYEVQLQFGKDGKSIFKQVKLTSSGRVSEPDP